MAKKKRKVNKAWNSYIAPRLSEAEVYAKDRKREIALSQCCK